MITPTPSPIPPPTPDCLLCAVRQLTEGDPGIWLGTAEGDSVTGVLLKRGPYDMGLGGPVVGLTLWTGGMARVLVPASPATLRSQVHRLDPRVGDRVSILLEGWVSAPGNRRVRKYVVTVERGHH